MISYTDAQLRDLLSQIDDDDDTNVTSWESNFLDTVLYKYQGPLSDKQRAVAESMIEKYRSK